MTRDIGKSFLHNAKDHLLRPDRQQFVGWQRAQLGCNLHAGAIAQGLALQAQRFKQPDVLQCAWPQLLQQSLHLDLSLLRGSLNVLNELAHTGEIIFPARSAAAALTAMLKICCLIESCRSRASRLRSSCAAALLTCCSNWSRYVLLRSSTCICCPLC